MWRGPDYEDIKRENRALIRQGKTPASMIDILSIVEHPAFIRFYEELMEEGLVGEMDEEDDANTASNGDLIAMGFRSGYQEFDFAIPFILREKEEEIQTREIDIGKLDSFTTFSLDQLKGMIGRGEKFHSLDVQVRTRFGDYRVSGGVMTATSYNDYLGRLVRRITEALNQPLPDSTTKFKKATEFPISRSTAPGLRTALTAISAPVFLAKRLIPLRMKTGAFSWLTPYPNTSCAYGRGSFWRPRKRPRPPTPKLHTAICPKCRN
jgi:type III restriction enzyme